MIPTYYYKGQEISRETYLNEIFGYLSNMYYGDFKTAKNRVYLMDSKCCEDVRDENLPPEIEIVFN